MPGHEVSSGLEHEGNKVKPRPTQEDYAAFEAFRAEVLREQLREEAEEQERQGGPPLTEMSLPAIDEWLRAFHQEASQLVQRENDGSDGKG
jgi:hypothetical protein